MTTKIEWTDETWNPVTGCTPVSAGCQNCYAARMARRLAGRCGYPPAPYHFDVTLHPERLDEPRRWHKPRMIFVCSMSDFFHVDVPVEFQARVFQVVRDCPQHIFMFLTKRPEQAWLLDQVGGIPRYDNLWLGITAENQEMFDARYPYLAQIDAAVRFVSCEPLLSEINLGGATPDWVICGGESGPGARPMHPDWARSLRDQCVAKNVPFFFKQWGAWRYNDYGALGLKPERMGKKAAGRLLDGREWNEMPGMAR